MPSEWLFFFNGVKWAEIGGWGLFISHLIFDLWLVAKAKWYPEKVLLQQRADHTAELKRIENKHKEVLDNIQLDRTREVAGLRDGLAAALNANQELFAQQAKLLSGFSTVGRVMESLQPPPPTISPSPTRRSTDGQ